MKIGENIEIYAYADRMKDVMCKFYFLPAIVLERYIGDGGKSYYLVLAWYKWNLVLNYDSVKGNNKIERKKC